MKYACIKIVLYLCTVLKTNNYTINCLTNTYGIRYLYGLYCEPQLLLGATIMLFNVFSLIHTDIENLYTPSPLVLLLCIM